MKNFIGHQEVLSIVFESTHMLVAYLDADLRFIKVNQAYAEADDKTPDEFIGKRHFDLYPNEENERLFRDVVESGEPHIHYAKPFEYGDHPERGVTHWDWSLFPTKNRQGEVIGVVLQLVDVTDRIKTEEKLFNEQSFGEAVLAAANALVVVLDTNGKIKRFNTACEKVTGYTFEEMHDRYVWDFLLTDEEIEPVKEVFRNLADTALPSRFTNNWVTRDGSKRLIDWHNSTMFDKGGDIRFVMSVGVDVTDRTRMERELQESNQFNATVISGLPIGVAMYDESGQCVMVNEDVAKNVGATREQLLAQNFHDIASWKKSGMYDAATKSIDTGTIQRMQTEHMTSFGKEVAFDAWLRPILVGDKKYLLVMLKDISERRRDEKRIRDQAQIIDQIHDSVITTDLDGYITSWNKGAERIFGYSVKEAVNKHISLLYPESERATLQAKAIEPLVEKGFHEVETLVQRKNGELFNGHLSLTFQTDEQGNRIRMIGYMMDISGRIKAEQDLKQKERALSEAQAIAHVGNWVWDIKGGGIDWSDEIFRIFGFEPGSFEPNYEAFMDSIHEEDRKLVEAAVKASLADPAKDYQVQHRVVTPTNEIRTVQADGRIFLDDNGIPAKMVGTVKDITELKQASTELEKYRERLEELVDERTQELRAAQDALVRKERLATLGQLTATVSHELRNPLAAMRPSLYMIRLNADSENDKVQAALDRIEKSIARCDHIIDELLDFTRDSALELHSLVLDDWLQTVIAEQEIPDGINLEQEQGLDHLEMMVDPFRLRRAVINVIENALQSMLDESGSKVNVEYPELTVFTRDQGEQVEIGIHDRGVGIPPEVMPHIFETLYSTKGFGVGLGMPTVKNIMELHGGSIQVDSQPGEGTTVILRLPKYRS